MRFLQKMSNFKAQMGLQAIIKALLRKVNGDFMPGLQYARRSPRYRTALQAPYARQWSSRCHAPPALILKLSKISQVYFPSQNRSLTYARPRSRLCRKQYAEEIIGIDLIILAKLGKY